MSKHTIQRTITEKHTQEVPAASVLAALRAAGYLPNDASGVELDLDTDGSMVIRWQTSTWTEETVP